MLLFSKMESKLELETKFTAMGLMIMDLLIIGFPIK